MAGASHSTSDVQYLSDAATGRGREHPTTSNGGWSPARERVRPMMLSFALTNVERSE